MNIALIVIVYIAAVVVLLTPWSRVSLKTTQRRHIASDPYRAISLACDSETCEEMAFIGGRRFLIDDAPDIPLQQCAAGTCGCRYIHHEDRRSSTDRRLAPRRATMEQAGSTERRGPRGRRKSDWSLLAVSS